jgi:DNA-binding IclR family transcriptional regulator
VLAAAPTREMSATSISDQIGIDPARVHVILVALRKQGLAVSRWSHPDEPDVRLRCPLLYHASAYGLWVARGDGRSSQPVTARRPEHDRQSP